MMEVMDSYSAPEPEPPENFTEEIVLAMINSVDRHDSLVSLFGKVEEAGLVNEPLIHFLDRLHLIIGRPMETSVHNRIVTILTRYILNPLNNRKIAEAMYAGILSVLSDSEPAVVQKVARQMVLTMLADDQEFTGKPPVGFVRYAKTLSAYLTVHDICDMHKILFRLLNTSPKRKPAKSWSSRKIGEFQEIMLALFDRQIISAPAVSIMEELVKSFPDRPWYEVDVLHPLKTFFVNYNLVQKAVTIRNRDFMFPVVGYSTFRGPLWNIDRTTLNFLFPQSYNVIGAPVSAQDKLLRYVLEQQHSRHMFQIMLRLSKQDRMSSTGLEDQLADLMVSRMKLDDDDEETMFSHWMLLASQFLLVVSCGYVSLTSMVAKLVSRLQDVNLEDIAVGRFYLIWTLYQCVAVHSDVPVANVNFVACLDVFPCLFPLSEDPLPIPQLTSKLAVVRLSPGYIWMAIALRARIERIPLRLAPPPSITGLFKHVYDMIEKTVLPGTVSQLLNKLDHPAAVNAFFMLAPRMDGIVEPNKMDYTKKMADSLLDTMREKFTAPPTVPEVVMQGPCRILKFIRPLPMDYLDVISTHIKHILFQSMGPVFYNAIQNALQQSNRDQSAVLFLSPAFWETFSRLFVFEELDSLTFRFCTFDLPQKCTHAPAVLCGVFEVLAFRTPYIPLTYRNHAMGMCLTTFNQRQMYHSQVLLHCEQLMLRLVQNLSLEDSRFDIASFHPDPCHPNPTPPERLFFVPELDEFNRLTVLSYIRLVHINGLDASSLQILTALIGCLQKIMPHTWNPLALSIFHPSIQALYPVPESPTSGERKLPEGAPVDRNKFIKQTVEHWSQQIRNLSEVDIGNWLTSPQFQSHKFIYCFIWKQFFDQGDTGAPLKSPAKVAFVLEQMGYKGQLVALRYLVDYLLVELSSNPQDQGNRLKEVLGSMIWKYGVIVFDRLLLVLLMRNPEQAQEHRLSLFLTSMLLKLPEFTAKVTETLELLPPKYWESENYFEKLNAYYERNGPEATYFMPSAAPGTKLPFSHPRVPVYFSNVVLRCIPLVEIFLHRCLDGPHAGKSHQIQYIELVLVESSSPLGQALRYHDRPVTFLWQTFLFYDKVLKENISLKRSLFRVFIGNKAEFYPTNFYCTPVFSAYVKTLDAVRADNFALSSEYFDQLVDRLFQSMYRKSPFDKVDWRFHEFAGPTTHALYLSALELLTIPSHTDVIVDELLQIIWRRLPSQIAENSDELFHQYSNCVSLIISALPDRFFGSLFRHLETVFKDEQLENGQAYQWDLQQSIRNGTDASSGIILQLFQNVLLHSGTGHLMQFLEYLRSHLTPAIFTEAQLTYVLTLCVPILSKGHADIVHEFVAEFALIIRNVAAAVGELKEAVFFADVMFYIRHVYRDVHVEELEIMLAGLTEKNRAEMQFVTLDVSTRDSDMHI